MWNTISQNPSNRKMFIMGACAIVYVFAVSYVLTASVLGDNSEDSGDAKESITQTQASPQELRGPAVATPNFRDYGVTNWKEWANFKIILVIIAGDNPFTLKRLCNSMLESEYLGWRVDVKFFVDSDAEEESMRYLVDIFHWPHGQKTIQLRHTEVDRSTAIIESWFPHDSNEFAVVLEDTVELSPYFYSWLTRCLLHYHYSNPKEVDEALFGISLYTPTINEIDWKLSRFSPTEALSSGGFENDGSYPPLYLHQLPATRGALFFPYHWREFREHLRKTNGKPITIPQSRTNAPENAGTWFKAFAEYAYTKGWYMIYPNFKNSTSFATTYSDKDETEEDEDTPKSEPRVPLAMVDVVGSELPKHRDLPDISRLPILDLHGVRVSSRDVLVSRGLKAQKEAREGGAHDATD